MNLSETVSRALPLSICDRQVSGEVVVEHLLPDYEAEIRRLLRVTVTPSLPSSYVGGGNAAFSGTLCFTMLYVSPEGKLCTAKTTGDYELSAPLDKEADVDYADEILAFCDLTPEATVSRVLSPRKVSLKCRLRAKIRAYGRHTPTETLSGNFSPEGIERLADTASVARLASALSEDIEVFGELEPTRAGEPRVIGCEGCVHLSEAVSEEGAALCRGEVALRVLMDGEEGVPYLLSARLPFAERVEGEGFREGMSVRAYGALQDAAAELQDGKIALRAALRLGAEGQENTPVSFTRDLYSTRHETATTYEKRRYPHAALCRTGNFTQSLYEPLEAYDIPADAEILDLTATARAEDLLCDRGKWALAGETRLCLLFLTGGEYKTAEIPLPFRYELEGECGKVESYFADIHMTGGRARVDGARLAVDCEIGVSLRAGTVGEATVLKEASFGARVPACEDYVVCFPTPDDSLWEIGKRYHTPLARLRALNSLAENDNLGDYLIVNG